MDNPTEVTIQDIEDVTSVLMNNEARTMMEGMEGQDKFGTTPVPDAFMGLCSTRLSADLRALPTFQHKNAYPDPMKQLPSEWGSAGSVRFFLSSLGSVIPNGSFAGRDIFNIFIMGMDAYGCIDQDSYPDHLVYRDPMYSGPLAMNCSLAWKMADAVRITHDTWIMAVRCTRRIN